MRKQPEPGFSGQIQEHNGQFSDPGDDRPYGSSLDAHFRTAKIPINEKIITDHIDTQGKDRIAESNLHTAYGTQTGIKNGGKDENRKCELQDLEVFLCFQQDQRIRSKQAEKAPGPQEAQGQDGTSSQCAQPQGNADAAPDGRKILFAPILGTQDHDSFPQCIGQELHHKKDLIDDGRP